MRAKLLSLLAIVALCVTSTSPAIAAGPTGGGGGAGGMGQGHRVTDAERKAAAVKAAKQRKAAGGAAARAIPGTNAIMLGSTTPAAVPTGTTGPLATPDYFGDVPNYANSPLPTSVSIQGDGVGAFATAAVNGDGTIGGFNLVSQGSGYTFADVVVIGGGGSGATGTATIDPGSGAITAIALGNAGAGYGSTPGIRKFVDSLPLLGTTPNDLGQYLPIAQPDTTTFDGSRGNAPAADYYEIAAVQYTQQMHSDLPPTTLRGYVQIATSVVQGKHIALSYPDGSPILDGNGAQVYAVDSPQYLGPVIVAQKDRPVRIKFDDYLPAGTGGDLFLPVDPTVMGAGMGPNGGTYSQNRADVHLHGGVTPWISDGTPDQWTSPATSTEQYPKGVSVAYVPDQWYDAAGNDLPACDGLTTCSTPGASTNPGNGRMSLYYTNQQSARLMFYHDHVYGITRLNVYAGEAAGYLLQDQAEAALVQAGTLPSDQLPLVIEDKTFVPSTPQLAAEDPTWDTTAYGGYGGLWFPHVYMPNQNPSDISGANPMGRWDYGPWFWPPNTQQVYGPVPNPYACGGALAGPNCASEPPTVPGTPNASIVPEAFMDTMTVNGTAYPFVQVGQKQYRLRILNASNDRSINLSLYYAGTETNGQFVPCNGATWSGNVLNANGCSGEVPMVAANQGGAGTTGYTSPDQLDGRAGGVPDSRAAGPSLVQIGTEGGLLSKPVTIPNGPVGYNYNRRDIVVLNVSNKSLLLGPAERADVVVDFSGVPEGSTLILYNDAPAPVPAFDTRYDFYTGDADQVMTGGAPTTLPGYGPNTRTVLQFQVSSSNGTGAAMNRAALDTAVEHYYGQMQAAPVVPEQGYDAAFGTSSPADPYARIQDYQSTFQNGSVTSVAVTAGGSGYTKPPVITLSGGGGSGATAYATLSGTGIASITITDPGSGYTSPPAVTISPPELPGGTQATAVATLSTTVASVAVSNGGSGYTTPPAVSFSGGGATTPATGTAVLAASGVASVGVTAGGSYTTPPAVTFDTANGSGAAATAALGPAPVASVSVTAGGSYTAAPTVSFSSGSAAATAALTPTSVGSLAITSPGAYDVTPTVSLEGGGGSGATAVASLGATGVVAGINVGSGGTGYTTPPNVTLSAPPTGTRATAAVTAMAPTGVGSVRITSGGSCTSRTSFPVTFTSVNGLGSGAAGTATIGGNRRVNGVTITSAGSGYTLPPTPDFSAGTNCTGVAGTSTLLATSVLTISVTNPGTGYTSAPRVSFSGGGGSGATATSVLAKPVASLTLTNGGSGYTSAPTVVFAPGAGQQPPFIAAAATATLTPTTVASVTVTSGGSYAVAPTVTFDTATGSGAAATAILGPAPVASITVTAPGAYTAPPAVSFSSGSAAATAQLAPTSVASVTLASPGAGYNTAPAVSFSGGGGSGAAATATLAPGGIAAITSTFAGSGYVNPTIAVGAPQTPGTTATATASVSASSIASIVLTNPGSGYTSAPTVNISGDGSGAAATAAISTAPVTLAFQPKGIQELFDPYYGRMNATMSVEIPNTNGINQTTIPYGYIDSPTELIDTNASSAPPPSGSLIQMLPDGTQVWKFTHNGVDTHAVHFHMFNVQLINRVGWDGAVRPPDPNEMGWKETIRMNPLEDAIIAIKPIVPDLPWPLPNSIRPLDPAEPIGATGVQFTNVDPNGLPVTESNHLVNLGWEYVYHCHLLGHEENDMMRAIAFGVAPSSPTIGVPTAARVRGRYQVTVPFIDTSVNETGFTVQRSTNGTTWTTVGTVQRAAPTWNAVTQKVTDAGLTTGGTVTFTDTGVAHGTTYLYRVIANNVIGDTQTAGFPSQSVDSVASSASVSVTP